MKKVELQIISELIKNSKRSDRELAKVLGVSQPTVTRTRTRLEKEDMLDYTAIPNLAKLGFGIIAIVFGKRNLKRAPESRIDKAIDYAREHPNIIFASAGEGLGFDRISISIHKDYSDYAEFTKETKAAWAEIMDVESFLIDLNSKDLVQPLSLKTFAKWLAEREEKPE